MGVQYHSGVPTFRSIGDNLEKTKKKYPTDSDGYFGKPGQGRSHTRNIESENPLETAQDFFDNISEGGERDIIVDKKTGEKKGVKATMNDGSIITYREISSSDGSPVVEINITRSNSPSINTQIQNQKIHFVKGDSK